MKEETTQYPVVIIENDHTQTNSLNIAAYFKKQHKDVLKAIANLEISEEFARRNFALSEYIDSTGRKLPMYNLTRNGFTMLAFGFSGPRAMQFKEAYIATFDKMEEILRQKQIAAISMDMAKGQLAALRSGIALHALLQDKHALERVERSYYFRTHGMLTHYEAADACRLEYNKADEIARTLREIGVTLPNIYGNHRKKEIGRFFAKAVGGFLPDDLKEALIQTEEVAHEQ